MSRHKYPSIFLPQMETIMFIILQIFYGTHAVLKIRVYSQLKLGDIRPCDVFRPITHQRKDLTDYNLGYPPVLA